MAQQVVEGSSGEEATHKHVRIREYVRDLCADASPGDPTPSERELVQQFGVARMTVRQALDTLVAEGLLERVPGRGTFVARPKRSVGLLLSFSEEMARRGHLAESTTMLAQMEPAGARLARTLGIPQGDPVVHWRRLRRTEGQVVGIQDHFFLPSTLPGFLDQPMPTSFYDALSLRGDRPIWADDQVVGDVATQDEATTLELTPGAPVLRINRRGLTTRAVIEATRMVFRADRFVFRVQLGANS